MFYQLKLGQGVLLEVSSPLIKRQKVHFVNLPCGVSIILGRNGFIWVTTTSIQETSQKNGGFTPSLKVYYLILSISLNFFLNFEIIANSAQRKTKY